MKSMQLSSLPYEEPGVTTILTQSSLLLLLNVVNFLLDKAVYCGLLGQVFLGVAWGTPGADWLGPEVENAIVQLGYLGLLLLVYEGGLSTSFRSLKANLFLSLGVAATGICLPIGLSFVLRHLTDATPLQCFAAGAALCSTSLGTTFTVLGTSGLIQSRLGVVLTSAAMMDDVIGLVMVQIISNLGQQSTSFSAVVVVRPLFVSLASAVAAPLICVFVASPITSRLNRERERKPSGYINRILEIQENTFVFHTLILVGYIAAASYAGTSNLFAAYIAGASISWWDSEVPHPTSNEIRQAISAAAVVIPSTEPVASAAVSSSEISPDRPQHRERDAPTSENTGQKQGSTSASGLGVYERFYSVAVNRILRPFFFASIGFSIPISEMFAGEIVWKGLVYTLLMMLGKILCGAWLVRLSLRDGVLQRIKSMLRKKPHPKMHHFWGKREKTASATSAQPPVSAVTLSNSAQRPATETVSNSVNVSSSAERPEATDSHDRPAGNNPRSIYPASILGCAMMARGEIGFLISSIAESKGVFASGGKESSSSKLFLIVTWAIMLCTILGPLAVGLLVRRVKWLEIGAAQRGNHGRGDVLGVWGVK